MYIDYTLNSQMAEAGIDPKSVGLEDWILNCVDCITKPCMDSECPYGYDRPATYQD